MWVKNSVMDELVKRTDVVECERCGCLLEKRTAHRGKSVIKEKERYILCYGDVLTLTDEVIREVYYCKVHKPKCK